MFDKITFFNQFGAGDIFESRGFVKEWMELVPAKEYYYAHNKHPRILLDIPELKYIPITPYMNPRQQIWKVDNELFVNTWIGITGRYLLPGIGCTVERLYDMHNDMLKVLGLQLSGVPVDYIPEINYNYYELEELTRFVMNSKEELIFIDNGQVISMQAENFPMEKIILSVADNHKDKCFIVTHELSDERDNIYSTDFITNFVYGFDLPEISYISLFCSALIGRNSGPHVFTQVKKNVMDESKKLLSFTYKPTGASFVVNSPVKIKRYWSGATDTNQVTETIERVIDD